MKYKVSTVDKKSVIEKNYYEKDGKTLYIEQGYRWGYFVTEDKVDLEKYDPEEGLMIFNYDVIEHSFDDGCWIELKYDDDRFISDEVSHEVSDEERDEIDTAWYDNGYEGIEALGWRESDNAVWFMGELEVSEKEDE